jgi:hypothetical protein
MFSSDTARQWHCIIQEGSICDLGIFIFWRQLFQLLVWCYSGLLPDFKER